MLGRTWIERKAYTKIELGYVDTGDKSNTSQILTLER